MRGFNSDELLNRTIRGTVRVMSDGNIRWSFVSSVRMRDVNKQILHIAHVCLLSGFNV